MKEQRLVLNSFAKRGSIKATRSKIKAPSDKYQRIINEANKQIELTKEKEVKTLVKAKSFYVY